VVGVAEPRPEVGVELTLWDDETYRLRGLGRDLGIGVDRLYERWELSLQGHFLAPPELPPESPPEPEPEPASEPPKEQLAFPWWKDWRKQGRRAKAAPVRAWLGYARGLAYYLEHIANARGGSLSRVLQGPLSALTMSEALHIIRVKRQRLHKKRDVETASSPADCAVLWYGSEDGARPCGCGDNRVCSLCGPMEADSLAKDAAGFLYEEFLEAAKPLAGKLECMGAAWELTLHKRLSSALQGLMGTDSEGDKPCKKEAPTVRPASKFKEPWGSVHERGHKETSPVVVGNYRKEINRMSGEEWEVIQLAYPGGKIGGHQSIQLYGESNPGEDHIHWHNVVAPVVVVGKVWETFPPEVRIDDQGRAWESNKSVRVPGNIELKPLPGFVSTDVYERQRLDWGRRQINLANRLGVPLSELGVKYDEAGKPFLVGDVHHSFFGFKKGWSGAVKRAKGYLGYQARWPGQDVVSGLKSDGSKYTWTGPMGSKPKPEVFGQGAKFTGKYAKGGRPIYERKLSPEAVARAIWRLDRWPGNFARLRWRGFLSTGNVKQVMDFLGWEKVKVEPPEEEGFEQAELLKPVGRSIEGLIFKAESDDREVCVSWSGLGLGPVTFTGESLNPGRKTCWVSKEPDLVDDS